MESTGSGECSYVFTDLINVHQHVLSCMTLDNWGHAIISFHGYIDKLSTIYLDDNPSADDTFNLIDWSFNPMQTRH